MSKASIVNEDRFRLDMIDLYSEINLNSLLSKIADKICLYLNCEESSIFLYDSAREELYFEIATGDKQQALKQIVFRKGEGIVGWVAEKLESVVINDCLTDTRFTSKTDRKTNFKTKSIVGVPVLMDGSLLGVLEAINKKKGQFDQANLDLLTFISQYVSIPLQNAILFKKVMEETQKKDQLIELGKIISSTFNLSDVFQTLNNIICEIASPDEINVMVKSQNLLYKLVQNETVPAEGFIRDSTDVFEGKGVFPLRTENQILGWLEVKMVNKIPEEMISLLKGLAVFAAISIEKSEMIAQMIEKERIEKELQIAKEIQQSFLIQDKMEIAGLDIAYINIPSSAVGGDYYDIIPQENNRVIFTINDISGHGVPASLLMSIFRSNFVYSIKQEGNLLKTISYINNLVAETTEANLFVTSFMCSLDIKEKKLRYINAGHNSPILIRKNKVIPFPDSSIVLGLFPDMVFEEFDFSLESGDLLVMYTDGVAEAENEKSEELGEKGLQRLLKKNVRKDAEGIKDSVIAALTSHVESEQFLDDVTFIIVKIL